jgi:hypothetical protein
MTITEKQQSNTYSQDFLNNKFIEYKEIRKLLIENNWKTPNSYGGPEYSKFKKTEGVYIIILINTQDNYKTEISYIGRSFNLKSRHISHPVNRYIKLSIDPSFYTQIWFLERNDSVEFEKYLIHKIKPKFNQHHKNG